jgi:hypothetical protein
MILLFLNRAKTVWIYVLFSVLHVYPILKRTSHVSPSLRTETDLLRAHEVRELGNMLLAVYSDLIKNADLNLDERIQSKAIVLNRQAIKPRLIKVIYILILSFY